MSGSQSKAPAIASVNNVSPLVSIGIPTYNGAKRIIATIKSIVNQGYPNLEIIISDNCSSDNTEEVCVELSKTNPSIKYFRQKENIGIIGNYKYVLSKASGELYMWVADDDSLEPGILKKYVDFLTSHNDYLLVSGQIRYWTGNKAEFVEKDLSMEQSSCYRRVIGYYNKVVQGAMYYGLMSRQMATKLPLQNRMGEDWHFVAKAAFLGKIKMLDCIGYNKKLNGSSKTLKHYAKLIGAPWFTTNFPHSQIAFDAFAEIMTSPIYNRERPFYGRLALALGSCFGVLFNHYFREYPFIIGGKIRRLFGFRKKLRTPNSLKEWAW
jgi:glycosyltransferase involved in cell wall biosynthesis